MAFAWIWQQIAKQIYFPTSISESWLLRRNQNCKAGSSPGRTIPPTLPFRSKTIVEKKLGGLTATQDWAKSAKIRDKNAGKSLQGWEAWNSFRQNGFTAFAPGSRPDLPDKTVKMWPNSLSGLFRSKNGNVSGRVGTMRDDQDRGDGSHQDHLGLLKVHKESFSSSSILSHLLAVIDVLRWGAS